MDQEKFGKFIKEIRQKNHLTQKQLASKYHVTYQAVSKWENGRNMPDTSLIKQMSSDFHISLDDFFEGKYSQKSQKKKNLSIALIIIVFSLFIIGGICYFHCHFQGSFEFTTLKSERSDFDISGSISYNDSKSSIYISDVRYSGLQTQEKYSSVKCTLYENNNDSQHVIDTCHSDKEGQVTLQEFLKDVSFTVDNYQKLCKNYSKDSLYLEIEAIRENAQTVFYKIPLVFESQCQS